MVDQVLQSNYGSDRSSGLVAIALLVGGLVGGLALSPAALAGTPLNSPPNSWMGQGSLIAQEIVDGLPPPPNVGQTQQVQSQEMTAPTMLGQSVGDRRYLVMINGDNPRLLRQVQRVASSASVQDFQGQRMIVAAFDDPDHAQRQVQILTSRGIGARLVQAEEVASAASPGEGSTGTTSPIAPSQRSAAPMAVAPDLPPADLMPNQSVPTVQVPSQMPSQMPNQALRAAPSDTPREVNFGGQSPNQPPSASSFPAPTAPANAAFGNTPTNLPSDLSTERGYYVVIPGKQGELEAISNQIMRLGDGFSIAQMVQQSSAKGTHVQVGPFNDRQAANRWNRYFRDFGMDARVTRDR